MDKTERKIDGAWESRVLERLAREGGEMTLLDLAQDAAIKLAAALGDARHELGMDMPEVEVDTLLRKIARVSVLADAVQLLYGDAVEEEIAFLEEIEAALE